MNEHLAFAQCLQRVLNETELTATEVARRLEMRSRNSIFRILKGKTSPQLNRRFLESFHKHMGEQLTEAQWAALNRALEMDAVGAVEYKSRQALMQLVGAFSEPISPAKVCYLDALGAEKEDSFLHYLQVLFCGALKVNALLFGCCDLGLFRQLQEAIHPVAQRVIVRIDHFIYAGEDEIVSNLVGIQPMVDQPCYHAYLVDAENCPQERLAHYRTGQMTFHVMHQDGSESTVALFLLGKNEFTATVMSTQDLWMSRKVLCDRERFSPIRLLWQLNDENSDFIVYTQQYCKMEHGAAIYYIRPDVPFQYIPLEVLYPVVREGFARMGMTREEYEPNVTALAEIHQARMTNMMRRRRPTYIVLNKAAMEEFVRTGRQSDHLHFLRNFTPKERKQILDVLVQQARENPFFHLYFAQEKLPYTMGEVALYDGRALITMSSGSGYDLRTAHRESCITHPFVLRAYKQFYMNTVVARLADTQTESLNQLEELVRRCEKMIREGQKGNAGNEQEKLSGQ